MPISSQRLNFDLMKKFIERRKSQKSSKKRLALAPYIPEYGMFKTPLSAKAKLRKELFEEVKAILLSRVEGKLMYDGVSPRKAPADSTTTNSSPSIKCPPNSPSGPTDLLRLFVVSPERFVESPKPFQTEFLGPESAISSIDIGERCDRSATPLLPTKVVEPSRILDCVPTGTARGSSLLREGSVEIPWTVVLTESPIGAGFWIPPSPKKVATPNSALVGVIGDGRPSHKKFRSI